jgi:hypothetical protein
MMQDGKLVFQGKWDGENGDLEKFYLKQLGEADDYA